MWQIASTYKARDVEEWLDRLFYRPVGYGFARLAQALEMNPNTVTVISIFLGVTAGHLFYYNNVAVNTAGILLLVWAEALDSTDGQLARMTGSRSRFGRILDGIAGNLMFISIYAHLCFRMIAGGASWWVFLVAIAAGSSHSFQCAVADYYRNAYLYFVYGEKRSELDRAAVVGRMYAIVRWLDNPLRKFMLRVYLNYTRQQEWCARSFLQLREAAARAYGKGNVPPVVRSEYARQNKPLLKYYNIITTNTRMIALFCAVIIGIPIAYFLFEIIVLNAVLLDVHYMQERANARMLRLVTHRMDNIEAPVC